MLSCSLAPTSLEHQPQVEGGVPEAKGEEEPGGFHMEGVRGGHSLSHGARMGGTKLHHTGRSKVW